MSAAKKAAANIADPVAWACPKCGATEKSEDQFVCECDEDAACRVDPIASKKIAAKDHGVSHANPCRSANCYACGWGGTFPPRPRGLPSWARKALDAGWTPPKGWTP